MNTHPTQLHTIGQTYHQFKLTRITEIPELQCTLRELTHEPSGAQVMHIANDDPENLFCLSFQTLPYNSNGVAHILEHTVLCGSKKFPVKDPFFAMNRRSLNTFMNALTGSDFTCYPAASQVKKDFYNLLEVYLDAVFHPLLNRLSFLQEGHRMEFSQPDTPSSSLEFKGIVYNEMKGALSSASARLSEAVNAALFPSITYGFNSGGDPKEILDLTYDELIQFHNTYYHPSRCLFFFYGDMPLENHLDFIAEHTLDKTGKAAPLPSIPLQPRFTFPVYREETYPIAPDEETKGKALISFGWLTCHIHEQQDALALNLLEIILMDTDASPLKQALLKTGLCTQANAYIDVELNEIPIGITLKGCEAESADSLQKALFDTLEKICQTGIPPHLIENAIHQLEFHRSEITGDHAPFGLSLFMRSALLKQHGVDPAEGLQIHALFERLHQAILSTPNYFSGIIKKYFIENPHFIRIIMRPDSQQDEREHREEKERFEQIKASLTPDQSKAILEQAKELATFQKMQEEEDIDILPKVAVSDIPLEARDYPLTQEKIGPLTTFYHHVFTNEIVYADLVFNLPNLKESELADLRLLSVAFHQVGCGERTYQETLDEIQGSTGGIHTGISLNLKVEQPGQFSPTFHIKGKALYRKVPELFNLMKEITTDARLDNLERMKEILFNHYTGMESRLSQNALKYAINLSASALNTPSRVANDLYGLSYFWKIRDLVKDFDNQAPQMIARLQEIQRKITCLENPHLILSCTDPMYSQIKAQGFYGLKEIKLASYEPWIGDFPATPVLPQGRVIASPVAFIGKVIPTVSYTHPDAPALSIASFLFDNLTLHAKIREQGGAYGGGSSSNPMSGNFYFYSHRDPNIVATLNAFEEAVNQVVKGNIEDEDLEEAKFEMIQGLDSPISPGSQAEVAYSWLREGRTHDIRQAFRNRLLSLTRDDIIAAVERIIVPNMHKGSAVVFAGKELLEKANQELAAEGKEPFMIEAI